ncbi:MAG: ComF family protein [Prevotella sp.]
MIVNPITRLLDLISPRRCVICDGRLNVTEELVCSQCLMHLPRLNMSASPRDNVMARMFWGQVEMEHAATFMQHIPHSPSSKIIYNMKYLGHTGLAVFMGRMAAREMAADGFFEGIDLIVPIPLARKRQRQRGYNQSELIAKGIGEVTGIKVETKAVKRTRFEKSQTGLTRYDRRENTKGIFQLRDATRLKGRHVLIVDDVITSGATMTACAEAIAGAGSVRMSAMTLAMAGG